MTESIAAAWFGDEIGTELVDVTSDLSALEGSGRWAVMVTFEGDVTCARFTNWRKGGPSDVAGHWLGPKPAAYETTMARARYVEVVEGVRDLIAQGQVYQVNVCRRLSAPMPDACATDVAGLAALLGKGNPAPFAGGIQLPEHGIHVASASPELFIRRDDRVVESGPIKGTGRTVEDLSAKDEAENVMIVDLVRNDLGAVCETGSVSVPSLLATEHHPSMVHLVSTVRGVLRPNATWPDLFAASFPPGSVSGAPKSSALKAIHALESTPRGPYCGAIGWVDADTQQAELAVGIRTFWLSDPMTQPMLNFGTGAGITWGSDSQAEWDETELKAAHLIEVASGEWSL